MAEPFFPGLRKGYAEVKGDKPNTNVFVRFDDKVPNSAPAYPSVKLANFSVRTSKQVNPWYADNRPRGASEFQLFATCHVEPTTGNRFKFAITEAGVDARISVLPKAEFETVEDFAPIYEKFAATATFGKGWQMAADKFAEGQISAKSGVHWSTDFDGIQAKTVRHELDHVKFAIKECEGLLYNIANKARSIGKTGAPGGPEQKVHGAIEPHVRFGFPYFDVGAKEHKQIAKRDVFFMCAWYELYVLERVVLNHAAYKAMLEAVYDTSLSAAMKQLGQTFPWTS